MAIERDAHAVLGVRPGQDWVTVRRAYWSLARQFHPDGATPDVVRMTEINEAYAALERARESSARSTARVGAATSPGVAMGPGSGPAPDARGAWVLPAEPETAAPAHGLLRRMAAARHADSPVIDFGQYAGWRIAEVAERDPSYLRWLSRHSSGIRYRRAIAEALGGAAEVGRRAAVVS